MSTEDVRLGHALRGGPDAVGEAVALASGVRRLVARTPEYPEAVTLTERALGIDPASRPVYAYLGDLHPGLGTVGLIVDRSWCRALSGVTRCDSGGLAGRLGAFAALTEDEALDAVHALSFSGPSLPAWNAAFASEVDTAYPSTRAYVDGAEPETRAWTDARVGCIARSARPVDRRLWTWEARFVDGPDSSEITALVLSHEAGKLLPTVITEPSAVPEHVRILTGDIGPDGAHFHTPRVRDVLAGAR